MDEKLILCIDDDELFLRMITSYLEAFEYAVLPQTSGSKALQSVTERSFHAVVLDCFVRDSSNCELVLQINQLQPETPILILTASKNSVPARVSAIADAVLSKENGLEQLISALDRVPTLSRPRAVRKYSRYPLHLPFIARLIHSNREIDLRGTTVSIGEGGLGGTLDSELYPGEDVLIEFAEPQLASVKAECQVRYRAGDVYGFEFLRLDPQQRQVLRQSCSQWIPN